MSDYLFRGSLADLDPEVYELTQLEAERQYRKLILIPSESAAPLAVREAMASAFQNIYAEGYPDEDTRRMTEKEILDYPARLAHYRRYGDPRYYKGTEYANVVESLARRRCAEAFAANGVKAEQIFVNVQALSGAPANNAVYHALVNPGDTVMGMSLAHGGHLTHGSPVNLSGKLYHFVSYGLNDKEEIDYDAAEKLALEAKPKMIVTGASAYSLRIDWKRFRAIADKVGAVLMADIAHYAGMVAVGLYPSPIGIADYVTSTTHKTLRGPRGGLILGMGDGVTDNRGKGVNSAIFPGIQGGPLMHVIAAKAVAFGEALKPGFKVYQQNVLDNASAMAAALTARGVRVVSGRTESHMMLLDLRAKKITGKDAEAALGRAHITVNKNAIPNDPEKPMVTSGIRVGTPAMTTRGFGTREAQILAGLIADVLEAPSDEANLARVRGAVGELCAAFPVYA
ncbi:MAG: serine hydroxymethyltransferase [Anaerolineales bacterium]|nr:serine hydroxymethyltransferase [Anaerolineales bacterium]